MHLRKNKLAMSRVLVCSFILACAQVSAAAEPPPELPKVVIIGDSIRLSYSAAVGKALKDKVRLASPPANGGDSGNVLRNLEAWVIRERPAVVHFNCGIHDTKKFSTTGKFQVSPEQYEANLKSIVERIRKETGAVVLFATTTPILDERAAKTRSGRDYELLNESVAQYNEIARRVMKELKVPVNDLHIVITKDPINSTADLIGGDGVHLTAKGTELLGKTVADFIAGHLPAPSGKLK